MGQVLHGSATTTEAIRRAIRHSQESLRALAKRYGINPKTVAKWKARPSVTDKKTGPKAPRSTVLSVEEEAVVVAFRRYTLLPLDDCLYALQPTIPHLTRSSLHRCLQRHGIARLPDVEGDKPVRRKFKAYPIGFFHIDIAEVRTEQGKLHMFVAIDRTSKFAFVELHETATTATSRDFLLRLIAAVPYKIHTVLTDNGIQFTTPGGGGSAVLLIKEAIAKGERFRAHAFELTCARHDIDHRTTKPKHPWTNGQVERMNRTLKDATVKRFYYESHDQLRQHLTDFVAAYNFARRLKTLKGLTPYEFVCRAWHKDPSSFTENPHHQMPGLNTLPLAVTPEQVEAYLAAKAGKGRSAATLASAAINLAMMARAIWPGEDWDWLQDHALDLQGQAEEAPKVRRKSERMRSVTELRDLARALMARAETAGRTRRAAALYQKGLIILMLTHHPVRRRNLHELRLGEAPDDAITGGFIERLPRGGFSLMWLNTKNGDGRVERLAAGVVEPMERWLRNWRPVLVTEESGDALWLSASPGYIGSPLTPGGLTECLMGITEQEFGLGLGPHLFRDVAATAIVDHAPELAELIPRLLGHRNRRSCEPYIQQASSVAATRSLEDVIERRIEEGMTAHERIERAALFGRLEKRR